MSTHFLSMLSSFYYLNEHKIWFWQEKNMQMNFSSIDDSHFLLRNIDEKSLFSLVKQVKKSTIQLFSIEFVKNPSPACVWKYPLSIFGQEKSSTQLYNWRLYYSALKVTRRSNQKLNCNLPKYVYSHFIAIGFS